jgi:acyl carrier protein
MPLLSRVQRIVSDVLQIPLEQVLPETSPDNVETWDSIQHLTLVLALEQEFGIQFSPEEIEQLLSVDLIAAFVEEKAVTLKP